MKKRTLIQTAILVSLIAHAAFLGASTVWRFPGAEALVRPAEKMFDIRPVELEPPPLTQGKAVQSYVEKLKFQAPGKMEGFAGVPEVDQKISNAAIPK